MVNLFSQLNIHRYLSVSAKKSDFQISLNDVLSLMTFLKEI